MSFVWKCRAAFSELDSKNILHESRWAVSRRCGNKVQKIFLHDAYDKIRKEVRLLQLSLDSEATLSFDNTQKRWVCESAYMELTSILDSVSVETFIPQLRDVFSAWETDRRFRDLIADEWSDTVIPWYSSLLREYLSDAKEAISWLQNSRAEHFVHGDFTVSNVYLDSGNQIVVLDFENATLGPRLWDETTLVYSLIEHKQYTMARKLFEVFSCQKDTLYAISSIRLAQSIRKLQNIGQRTAAHTHILRNY